MSEITINQKNLSRFTKRLQKSLSEHLNQEIPLHLASLIFAETLGVDSIHHLKEKLLQHTENASHLLPNDECKKIDNFITHYFSIHHESQLLSFYFFLDDNNLALSIEAKGKKLNSEEGFSVFFGSTPSYLNNELNRLSLTDKDLEFIHELVSFLHFDDLPLNIYLGERLKQYFKLEPNSIYDFKMNKEFESITNYGFCEKLYALVGIDFFERKGAPYVLHNDKYIFINLENENVRLFKTFSDAEKHIDNTNMLVEFLTPVNQFSNLVSPSKHKTQGICSHYFYKEKNQLIGVTANIQFKHNINNLEDFHFFFGQNFYNIFGDKSFFNYKLAINHPYRTQILSGFDSCLIKNQVKIKNSK